MPRHIGGDPSFLGYCINGITEKISVINSGIRMKEKKIFTGRLGGRGIHLCSASLFGVYKDSSRLFRNGSGCIR